MPTYFFLGIIFFSYQLCATVTLNVQTAQMMYSDFVAIQENFNLLEHSGKFYELEISEESIASLNRSKYIWFGRKTDNGYIFFTDYDRKFSFSLKTIDPMYYFLIHNFPPSVTMPLINKNDENIRKKINKLVNKNLCKGRILPALYYIAWEILALRGNSEARTVLIDAHNAHASYPNEILGGSFLAHKKIIALLENRVKKIKNKHS